MDLKNKGKGIGNKWPREVLRMKIEQGPHGSILRVHAIALQLSSGHVQNFNYLSVQKI